MSSERANAHGDFRCVEQGMSNRGSEEATAKRPIKVNLKGRVRDYWVDDIEKRSTRKS